jgi:hypothetical protein
MKYIPLFIGSLLLSFAMEAQTSLTLQSGLFMNKIEGGFVNTLNVNGKSLSAGISLDHTRGNVFGWSFGYSVFNKSFQFGYPITTTGTIPEDGHYMTGYVVRAHEIQSSFLMRIGKHINLSGGPYVQINTDRVTGGMGVDENFYYPSSVVDLYNNIELGYQGKLQLQFFLGSTFYFGAFANAGASLTDIRTKAWNDAWTYITGQQEDWESTPLKNIYQHYGVCIGIRGKQKQE